MPKDMDRDEHPIDSVEENNLICDNSTGETVPFAEACVSKPEEMEAGFTVSLDEEKRKNHCHKKRMCSLQDETSDVITTIGKNRNKLQLEGHNSSKTRKNQSSAKVTANTKPSTSTGTKYLGKSLRNCPIPEVPISEVAEEWETDEMEQYTKPYEELLQERVAGFRELLKDLALLFPYIHSHIEDLAEGIPCLRGTDVFPVLNIDTEKDENSRELEIGKPPPTALMICDDESLMYAALPKSPYQKAYKFRRVKTPIDDRSSKDEIVSLVRYINKIVTECLCKRQTPAHLKFRGAYEDLEAYGERLSNAGIGFFVEGQIKVNQKNNQQAFIAVTTDKEGRERDAIMLQPVARLHAFHGDTVRAFVVKKTAVAASEANIPVKNKDNSSNLDVKDNSGNYMDFDSDSDSQCVGRYDAADPTPDSCPKAFVTKIIKQPECRQIVGSISFKNTIKLYDCVVYFKFRPLDTRLPIIFVAENTCYKQFLEQKDNDICGILYTAECYMTNRIGQTFAKLLEPIGNVNNIDAEVKAILIQNGLGDYTPYEKRFNELFVKPDPPMTEEDLVNRDDLRTKCIFTIDPATARDLDDAVSIEHVTGNEYEVGVHISDVTHYLLENSELDNVVKNRATSIYLVNEVLHMLPEMLCYKCSLLPGEDKFAFSVFWHITLDGEILGKPRFTRSAIHSCTQLAYEHAQKVITDPDTQFDTKDFPAICNGFTPNDIVMSILKLHEIASRLREKRFQGGALTINNPKIRFNLDEVTGEPIGFEKEARGTANFLIEEFMLLSNQSVAKFIYDKFPDISILRSHGPPIMKGMATLHEILLSLQMPFDYSSSKSIQESIDRICKKSNHSEAMDAFLSIMLTKPMARAKYFCSEGKSEKADLWHYALSIPIYTHFTSPIRRYPDILVHRLLAAALKYCPPPTRTTEELHNIAKLCNEQKMNAQSASEDSSKWFFKRYIKANESITLQAVVIAVQKYCMNVVTIETGHFVVVHYRNQRLLIDKKRVPVSIDICERETTYPRVTLQKSSMVTIKVAVSDEKFVGFLLLPELKQYQNQLRKVEEQKQSLQQKQVFLKPKTNQNQRKKFQQLPKKPKQPPAKKSGSTLSGNKATVADTQPAIAEQQGPPNTQRTRRIKKKSEINEGSSADPGSSSTK